MGNAFDYNNWVVYLINNFLLVCLSFTHILFLPSLFFSFVALYIFLSFSFPCLLVKTVWLLLQFQRKRQPDLYQHIASKFENNEESKKRRWARNQCRYENGEFTLFSGLVLLLKLLTGSAKICCWSWQLHKGISLSNMAS